MVPRQAEQMVGLLADRAGEAVAVQRTDLAQAATGTARGQPDLAARHRFEDRRSLACGVLGIGRCRAPEHPGPAGHQTAHRQRRVQRVGGNPRGHHEYGGTVAGCHRGSAGQPEGVMV